MIYEIKELIADLCYFLGLPHRWVSPSIWR